MFPSSPFRPKYLIGLTPFETFFLPLDVRLCLEPKPEQARCQFRIFSAGVKYVRAGVCVNYLTFSGVYSTNRGSARRAASGRRTLRLSTEGSPRSSFNIHAASGFQGTPPTALKAPERRGPAAGPRSDRKNKRL